MGLDSVELVVAVERYFKINIADADAEKIYTIQNMVDCVAEHLNVAATDSKLRNDLFEKTKTCIQQVYTQHNTIQLNSLVCAYISIDDKEKWKAFEQAIGLKVPRPERPHNSNHPIGNAINKLLSSSVLYKAEKITFEQLIDAIAACNYQTLINSNSIKSKYEIYTAISGITVEKIGVDYYEIGADKSFTNDLGID
jgi:acyl carrier protein